MENILGIVISFVYIFGLIYAGNYYEKFDKEASRKFIHILLANWWLIAMVFFSNWIWALIPPIAFVIINYLSYKGNLLKSMERDDEHKDGLGTVYFAISLIPLVLMSFYFTKNPLIGLVGCFVMCYADGFASIIGKGVESKKYTIFGTTKSVAGSLAMFGMTLLITISVFAYTETSLYFVKALIISVIATILEAVSAKGTDNLTVPIVCSLLTMLWI